MTDGFKIKLFDKTRSNKYVKFYWSDMVDEGEEEDTKQYISMAWSN